VTAAAAGLDCLLQLQLQELNSGLNFFFFCIRYIETPGRTVALQVILKRLLVPPRGDSFRFHLARQASSVCVCCERKCRLQPTPPMSLSLPTSILSTTSIQRPAHVGRNFTNPTPFPCIFGPAKEPKSAYRMLKTNGVNS
jgi:hypothetical protein